MLRVFIKPYSYTNDPLYKKTNPFIVDFKFDQKKADLQFDRVVNKFKNVYIYFLPEIKNKNLSDIIFAASAGVCLPRLPDSLVILPNMKYLHRKQELKYIKDMYKQLNVKTIQFPLVSDAPFEGQAEIKWFHNGTKAICGYGYRSTLKSFKILNKLLKKIYLQNNITPPELLILPLKSEYYYHLDLAMLEFDNEKCIIHKDAFSAESTIKIQNFLEKSNVYIIKTEDHFCLNSVIDGDNLITCKLLKHTKNILENITKRRIIEVNVSEFQNSGGSVRCMCLDLF